jgi:hypothetical protein
VGTLGSFQTGGIDYEQFAILAKKAVGFGL